MMRILWKGTGLEGRLYRFLKTPANGRETRLLLLVRRLSPVTILTVVNDVEVKQMVTI